MAHALKYAAHIELISYGVMRVFKAPMATLASDGSPEQPYVWSCAFEIKDGVAVIKGALVAPPSGAMKAIVLAAKSAGAKTLSWERWDGIKRRNKLFKL